MRNARLRLQELYLQPKPKSLWPQVILALAICLITNGVAAEVQKAEILKTEKVENLKGGDLFLSIQKVENVMGVPYQVEVRGSCGEKKYTERLKAPVLHVQNFCDIRLSSLQLKGDQLSFQVKEVDAERFNKLTRALDPESVLKLKPTCLKEPQEVSWSLSNFCP